MTHQASRANALSGAADGRGEAGSSRWKRPVATMLAASDDKSLVMVSSDV
jgi:hypothetical protein